MNKLKPPFMPNIITQEAARMIFSRVKASKTPIAIFANNGSWQATKVNTTNFARLMERSGDKLVALYDINSRLEWIEQDLEAAGIK